MAKAYLGTVKYMIKAKFEVQGIVEKHDIIGAVFGQIEGLLGEDMDLKELQQSGKIGRIEVESENIQMGKVTGVLLVPSSMDMVKTSMLAAAVETVDKVGPYEAKFDVEKIEDARAEKRTVLAERAKQLLQRFTSEIPDTQEIASNIIEDKRRAELVEFGEEKLPAGPEVETSEDIVVVEGRADVINLLRNNVKNVIGMNGARIPQGIVDLSFKKRVTVFVDGDRGGELIARQLIQLARVEYVAKAPDGKEVEELARKEILLSLDKKIPADVFKVGGGRNSSSEEREFKPYREERGFRPRGRGPVRGGFRDSRRDSGRSGFRDRRGGGGRGMGRGRGRPRYGEFNSGNYEGGFERRPFHRDNFQRESFPRESFSGEAPRPFEQMRSDAAPEEMQKFGPVMHELQNSLKARFLDEKNSPIKEVSVRDLLTEMNRTPNAKAVVFDGIVTKRLVDAAQSNNIDYLVGVKKGKIEATEKVKVVTIA